MARDQILRTIAQHRKELEGFGVKMLSIFGSIARGEDSPNSDVDILVEFSMPVGLFEFIRLKNYLETILGRPVDLVTPDALKAKLRDAILKEAIRAA
jgi:predicted nucleotidyltransferase